MKKFLKSSATLILAFIIFLMNANVASASEIIYPNSGFRYPTLYNEASTEINLEDYVNVEEFNDYLVEQLKVVDGTSSIIAKINISQFKIPYSSDIATAINNFIWYNSPELFRFSGMGIDSSDGYCYQIRFYSYYTKEEYVKMLDEMYVAAEKLLTGIKGNDNLSDVEKALLLHDRIAITCQYDYDTYLNDYSNMPQTSYNAYGVLVLQDAVCMGYTLAYDYLLGEVGIKSVYCSSDSLNHAWNIVYINNTPYHVDITWDDPTWDMSGRVLHKNFLRSTEGIKATGHSATDFFTTPTDTTYDEYYWQNSNTAFQLIDDNIYYFDTNEKNLYKLNDINGENSEFLVEIPNIWKPSANSYYSTSYSMLVSDGEDLFYSTPSIIYKYDTETATTEEFYKPDLSNFESYNYIYGLEYQNCKITYVINNTPKYTSAQKLTNSVSFEHHFTGDWVTVKEPTFDEPGERQKICKICNKIAETEVIEMLANPYFTILENSVLDKGNNVVFANLKMCDNTEEIFEFSEGITFSLAPSMTVNDTDYIGTGSIITLYKNEEKVAEYKIIVNGDLNGDSVCDVLDVATTELYMNNHITLSQDECFAANGMAKEEIDINSFQYVVNTALERNDDNFT